MIPPSYFEDVRQKAEGRWRQLEADPELAAPWHQLFRQVQSPRHVLSELLQNADDAGATRARVELRDGEFIFSHNGEDFRAEHFESLCRFGYSNKRALHTIGFRGIGFKSTFSLGDTVYLSTPTLSVSFHRSRFTQPVWCDEVRRSGDRCTYVRVPIADAGREGDLRKNLEEWKGSPVSLLFFRSIRRLDLLGETLHWRSGGPGPIPGAEWMTTGAKGCEERHLRISSPEEPFPESALKEIQLERLLPTDDGLELPPCRVEIVLGFPGRLYVVLPTGVETALPFAMNAPFVQDPARTAIKDPEISPTNQWLLARIGRLACEAMVAWVSSHALTVAERVAAYTLLPDVEREAPTVAGASGRIVEEAFDAGISAARFILTFDNQLVGPGEAVVLPSTLYEVWPKQTVAHHFAPDARAILSPSIPATVLAHFLNWSFVTVIGDDRVVQVLKAESLPRPAWKRLLLLWGYLADRLRQVSTFAELYSIPGGLPSVRIVPVQGQESLFPFHAVVRLGEKQLLQSEEDWKFLSEFLSVMNPNWTRYLADQRRLAETEKDAGLGQLAEKAAGLLERCSLSQASDVAAVTGMVAGDFFTRESIPLCDCIRLARIIAKLNGQVSDVFRYVCRDMKLRAPGDGLLFDLDGDLPSLLPASYLDTHLVHEDYFVSSDEACSDKEWRDWLRSGRAGLLSFPTLTERSDWLNGRGEVLQRLAPYFTKPDVSQPYRGSNYRSRDWDFPAEVWEYWQVAAASDPSFWARAFRRIIQPDRQQIWLRKTDCYFCQVSQQGSQQQVFFEPIPASWVQRFAQLPCVEDSHGTFRLPADVFCRTAETESLISTEPFIPLEVDTERNRPLFLLLGVRTRPDGPDRLISQLEATLASPSKDLTELDRLYRGLDLFCLRASADEIASIQEAFRTRALILTSDGARIASCRVFIQADEMSVPGAAVVHPAYQRLALWGRLGIPERPTVDHALQWLRSLPSDSKCEAEELRRVKALLGKYPERIWSECRCWLNLEALWVPIDKLSYSLSMQSLVPWQHLFPSTRSKVADYRNLTTDLCAAAPFNQLSPLSASIEERIERSQLSRGQAQELKWLKKFAQLSGRVRLFPEDETTRVRSLARALLRTECIVLPRVQSTPFLDASPAGPPRDLNAAWSEGKLLIRRASPAATAKAICDALKGSISNPDINSALLFCSDRPDSFIVEYMEENFDLAPEDDGNLEDQPSEANPEQDLGSKMSTGDASGTDDPAGHLRGHWDDHEEGRDEGGDHPGQPGGGTRTGIRSGTSGSTERPGVSTKEFDFAEGPDGLGSDEDGDEGGDGQGRGGAEGLRRHPMSHRPPRRLPGSERDAGGSAAGGEEGGSGGEGSSRDVFRSLVRNDGAGEESEEQTAKKREVDLAAIDIVTRELKDLGMVVRPMAHGNPGYDLEAWHEGGDPADCDFIEVKGLSRAWEGWAVSLSATQMDFNHWLATEERGDKFVLAVVEHAGTSRQRMFRIRNPWGVISAYVLDEAWSTLDEGQASNPSSSTPRPRRTA